MQWPTRSRRDDILKITYDRETDQLYISLLDSPASPHTSAFYSDGIYADRNESGEIVGLDIEHASTRVDLDGIMFAVPEAS